MNKFYFRIACLVLGVMFFVNSKAQISSGGVPPSHNGVSYPYTTINLPPLDNEQEIARADSIVANCESCSKENVYFGSGIELELDILQSVDYQELENGFKLYKINFVSPTVYNVS